jgi:phosphocarrier protein HPr
MASRTITVGSTSGLHARPAALFVKEAGQFPCTIRLEKNGKAVDAKSLLGVMSLAAKQNDTLTIRAEGEESEKAVEHLASFLAQLG